MSTRTSAVRRPGAPDPGAMAWHPVRVVATEAIGPHLRRVTLTGPTLSAFPFAGADQRVKLFLPRPGQDRPHLDGVSTIPEYLALAEDVRPVMRTYTVRRHRPEAAELDIDFALHGEDPAQLGPASAWALGAGPGDEAALYGPAASYHPPAGARWQLIAGDESALPAIAAIAEHLPPDTLGHLLIEVPDEDDRDHVAAPAGVEVHWLLRGAVPAQDSDLLADALAGLTLPGDHDAAYAWLAGEASVVRRLRRHLVDERGLDRERITFTGYWRHGHAEDEA